MADSQLADLDFNQNRLLNARLHPAAGVADPNFPVTVPGLSGQAYYDTVVDRGMLWSAVDSAFFRIPRIDKAETVVGTWEFSPPAGSPFTVGNSIKVVGLNSGLLADQADTGRAGDTGAVINTVAIRDGSAHLAAVVFNASTGYRVAGAATSGNVLRGNGTNFVDAQLQAGDIGGGQALTRVDDTNVTLTLGGSPTTALLAATSITVGWAGVLSLARGGSNANLTAVNGGIVYSTATALAITAALTGVLIGNGAAAPTAVAGTNNYIPKWSSNSLTTTSKIYDDGSFVGINTASPAVQFAVEGGGIANQDILRVNNQGNFASRIWLRNSNRSAYFSLGGGVADTIATGILAGALAIGPTANVPVQFFNGATAAVRVTISTAGFLGVLTTTPSTELDVAGVINALTGFRVATAATSGNVLRGNGTNFVSAQLQAGDIGGGAALTRVDDTNITLTLGGSPSTALLAATSITVGWTGTLAAARLNANVVQSVVNDTNVTGSIATQALTLGWTGTLAAARLNANVVQSVVNDTNVTGSIAAQVLTIGWTGQTSIARGGHGQATAILGFNALSPLTTRGDLITRDATNNVRLGIGANTYVLTSNGTDASWQAVPGGFTGFANPTASVGLTAVNGVAVTAMRSDAAPALDQAIAPTWTSAHTWRRAGTAIQADEVGDSVVRYFLTTSGGMGWGPGNAIIDTTFGRTASGVLALSNILDVATGFRVAGGATSGNYLRGDGTNFVSSAIQAGDLPDISGTYVPVTRTITIAGTTNRVTSSAGAQDLSANRTWTLDIAATYVGQTSITTLGTVTTGTWNAGIIPLAYGGTNANLTAVQGGFVYSTATALAITAALSGIVQGNGTSAPTGVSGTQYGLPYWATATTVGTTAAGTATTVLHGNAAGIPTWSQVSLTADVSGVLPAANGGTNLSAFTANGVLYASSTSQVATSANLTWNATTLDVNGALDVTRATGNTGTVALIRNEDATNGYGLAIESQGTASTRYALTVRNLAGSTTYFHISTVTGSVGFVGLGTATPGYPFVSQSNSGPQLVAKGASGEASAAVGFFPASANSASRNWAITAYATTYGDLAFYESASSAGTPGGGSVRLLFLSGGHVLIGTTTDAAGSLLTVNGVINAATGYRVANAATSGNVLRGNGTNFVSAQLAYSDLSGTPTIPTGANPTASVGIAAVNGVATTFMRSDGAPALSQAIAPFWTSEHYWNRTGVAFYLKLAADTTARFAAATTGEMIWGPGGVAAVDTTLSRTASGVLSLTNVLDVSTGYRIGNAAASNAVLMGNGTNFVSVAANTALNNLLPSQGGNSGKFLTTDGTNTSWAAVAGASAGNPTASIGLTVVNGVAATFMRSDAAPPLSQAIAPVWTAAHKWQRIGNAFSTDEAGDSVIRYQMTTRGEMFWGPGNAIVDTIMARSASGVLDLTNILNVGTGFRVAGGATSGNVLRGNATNFVSAQLSLADCSAGALAAGTTSSTPSTGSEVANKSYVDTIAAGGVVTASVTSTGVTVATLWSYTVAAGESINVFGTITGRQDNGDKKVVETVQMSYSRDLAGSTGLYGTNLVTHAWSDSIFWSIVYDVSGNDVRIRVVGNTGEDVNWVAKLIVASALA